MAIIQVTKQELVEANLEYLLVPSSVDYDFLTETYIWDTSEPSATLCLLAGIGQIMNDKNLDTK